MVRSRKQVKDELAEAKARVASLEEELDQLDDRQEAEQKKKDELTLEEYKRYGRQLILPSVGLTGQLALHGAHVLIIGAGGLGCPVILYLAASGVGEITILDHDKVELSNLGRQVLHTESGAKTGLSKVKSAKQFVQKLNRNIKVNAWQRAFEPSLFEVDGAGREEDEGLRAMLSGRTDEKRPPFDLVLDCTDNPTTRHLVNAYGVKWEIPLVSGGAVRAEGVVGVYGLGLAKPEENGETKGPCYACVFPLATLAKAGETGERSQEEQEKLEEQQALMGTGSCSDEGVLGALVGTVGLGMVNEALKVLLNKAKPTLHLFSPLSLSSPYRTIKIRSKSPTCNICSAQSRETSFEKICREWEDPLCYFPGIGEKHDSDTAARIGVHELRRDIGDGVENAVVVDVRSETEFGICRIPGSINIPFPKFLKNPSLALSDVIHQGSNSLKPVYLVCRRGNDSFIAARALRRSFSSSSADLSASTKVDQKLVVKDVKGGLVAWSKEIDASFPIY